MAEQGGGRSFAPARPLEAAFSPAIAGPDAAPALGQPERPSRALPQSPPLAPPAAELRGEPSGQFTAAASGAATAPASGPASVAGPWPGVAVQVPLTPQPGAGAAAQPPVEASRVAPPGLGRGPEEAAERAGGGAAGSYGGAEAAPAPAEAAPGARAGAPEASGTATETSEPLAATGAEPRPPETARAADAVPRAEIARTPGPRVAEQVAVALSAASPGSFELRLHPEELGSVRLGLTASDGGVTVQLTAERPETMDLLRRHADTLARELRQAGYDSVTFRFGSETPQDQRRAPDQGAGHTAPTVLAGTAADPSLAARATHRPPAVMAAGSLDLRL